MSKKAKQSHAIISGFEDLVNKQKEEITSLKSHLEQANKALKDISDARFLDMGHGPICDHIYDIAEKALERSKE